jgi:hypothetical protein
MGLVTLCFSTRQACRAKKFIGRRAFLFLYEMAAVRRRQSALPQQVQNSLF